MIRGCIHKSLSVDGKEETDLTDEERITVLRTICNRLKPQDLNNILQALIEFFGEYECTEEPCETCGDYIETYTWKL